MTTTDIGFLTAVKEAKLGLEEGGIPIGACLVSRQGKVLGKGHNLRVQKDSATLHAEISAFENAGRLPASEYEGSTMYTTLSPCDMCTGACLLYKVARVVVGENKNFVGAEKTLASGGVEVVLLQDAECVRIMDRFISEKPEIWYEDIGETKTKVS